MSMYGQSHLDQTLGRYAHMLQAPPSAPASALTDLETFMRNVSADDRRSIESSPQVAEAKQALLLGFFDFMIGATPFGRDFCTGSGAQLAQNLLDTVKTVHKETAGEEQRKAEDMERRIREQEAVIKRLCEQLGVNDVANI